MTWHRVGGAAGELRVKIEGNCMCVILVVDVEVAEAMIVHSVIYINIALPSCLALL